MTKKKIYRSGVLPYIIEDGEIKILFMKPSNVKYGGDAYQIGKGKHEEGETDLEAGLREAGEELGLFVGNIEGKPHNLGNFLGRTTIYVCKIKDKNMFGEPNFETESTRWMTPEEFQKEGRDLHKPVVKAAVRYIEQKQQKLKNQLHEIELVLNQTSQHVDLSSFDFLNGEQVASSENGLPVMKATSNTQPDWIGFAIIKDDKPVASVFGKQATKRPNYFIIMWAWTDPEYRRQGLITSLYVTLYKKARYKLVSDIQQSPGMKKVWDAIPLPTKVLDTDTWQTYNRDQFSDDVLYDGNHRYRLLIEFSFDKSNDTIGLPLSYTPGHGQLNERSNYNADADIFKDYEKYTHPANRGQFI